ncbi:MAG: hypothetical protein K2W95_27085 [Candidatus Obscuribacterales bacterium]|nr:hypothetical protein [Candidatus Obscuribacterales bacterium]
MGKIAWWFVAFCGLFIIVFAVLKTVSNMRVEAEAEVLAQDLFNWKWSGENWESAAKITSVEVISRSDNDAVVKVLAKQEVAAYKLGETSLDISSRRSETVESTATMTLYKQNNKWIIGKVDL